MTTLLQLVERTRLAAGDHPTRDAFNATLTNVATAVTFLAGDKIPAGALIDTPKFESMLVLTKTVGDPTTGTVSRGAQATTPVTFAVGDDVYVGFRYTYDRYRQALNSALAAISTLFGNPTWDSTGTLSSKQYIYAVPAAATRVIDCMYVPSSVNKLKHLPFRFEPYAPAAAGLSVAGPAVQLDGRNPGTGALYIHYEKPWTVLVNGTDMLDALYPSHAEDCIVLGAIAYLSDEESFKRSAFDAAHGKQQIYATSEMEVSNDAARHLNRFLQRRAELAALLRRQNTTWFKG